MPEYSRDSIRNIALVAPHGTGKTSLAEGILFLNGSTDKLGKVDDGSSVLDYENEEKNRNMSINSHIAYYETKDNLINLIDTPGFLNFLYETESALKVVDGAVIVVGAICGETSVQLTKYWEMASHLPKMIFINKLDRENSSFDDTVNSITKELGISVVPITLPLGQAENLKGVIDLMEMTVHTYDDSGKPEVGEIPEELLPMAEAAREKIIESAAELDDELIEKYLEGETIDEATIIKMLHDGIKDGKIFPVFAGSSTKLIGLDILTRGISRYMPSPLERGAVTAKNGDGEEITAEPSEDGPLSAFVFKTISDPYTGKISIFRIFSGGINGDATVYNSSKESREKLGHMHRMVGKKQVPLSPAGCGDIVAVNKLKDTSTGDTFSDESGPVVIPQAALPSAVLSYAIEPQSRNDEDKLNPSLARIQEEDPTIQYHLEEETHEFLLSGTGQSHVEVTVNKLRDTYGVNVDLKTPRVPYKETIRTKVKAEGKYIKQTGGKGQYGDAWLEVEPLKRGQVFEFQNKIVGGAIPKNFIPSVEKGVVDAMKQGVLAGYPVVDIKVTLFDGKYHPVDSSDMAFQIAGSMGFKQAMTEAKPQLLEPIMKMEITIPEDSMGDVIGDVNARRGKVSGVDSLAGSHQINALIPMAEILTYAPELRSITSGRGSFTMDFSHYEEVPDHMAQKIIAESSKGEEAEA